MKSYDRASRISGGTFFSRPRAYVNLSPFLVSDSGFELSLKRLLKRIVGPSPDIGAFEFVDSIFVDGFNPGGVIGRISVRVRCCPQALSPGAWDRDSSVVQAVAERIDLNGQRVDTGALPEAACMAYSAVVPFM